MTTLVMIDDDDVFRELMSRRLEREGFRVAAFASVDAAEALEEEVGVVLLALMLGAESSLGAIERLNRRFQPAQLVVLTGYASIATTVEAMKRGATNYLAKPVALSQLLGVLKDGAAPSSSDPTPSARRMTPAELEWEHIQRVLLEHEGNISLTARALGMHRRTLQRKLKKHSPF